MAKDKKTGSSNEWEGLSFEQTLERLEKTVEALEQGGLPLAEALQLFEEGMKYARVCSEMLATVELKIARVQTAYGEQMQFLADEDDGAEGDDVKG